MAIDGNKVYFIIEISEEKKLKCIIVKKNDQKEEVVKLKDGENDEYIPCISFNGYEITIGDENDDSIQFIDDLINDPLNFKKYKICFQNKENEVIAETLFGLIIEEFKKKIERKYKIEKTIMTIASNDFTLIKRICTSLLAIELNQIEINPFDFNYNEQRDIFQLMRKNKLLYDNQIEVISKKIELATTDENQNELKTIKEELRKCDKIDEWSLEKQIKKRSIKVRQNLKLYTLNNYCIFIASRYFESINDHINLLFVCKKLRFNLEKFYYNPISITEQLLTFFHNIETLHIYNDQNKLFNGNNIKKYVVWKRVSYKSMMEKKRYIKNVEFKDVVLTKDDVNYQISNQKNETGNKTVQFFTIQVPSSVNEILVNTFEMVKDIGEIEIEGDKTIIPSECFEHLLQ